MGHEQPDPGSPHSHVPGEPGSERATRNVWAGGGGGRMVFSGLAQESVILKLICHYKSATADTAVLQAA